MLQWNVLLEEFDENVRGDGYKIATKELRGLTRNLTKEATEESWNICSQRKIPNQISIYQTSRKYNNSKKRKWK